MKDASKLTRNQALVLSALEASAGPASAYALLDRLREEGLKAPPQIYRALEKLIEYGLVHKLESLNAFVACAHEHDHGECSVMFAICDACGKVEEFCDTALSRRIASRAGELAFRPAKTTIEIGGTCSDCLTRH